MKDKVILITGGSSGIGLATALLSAKQGAKVVIAGRNTDKGEQAVEKVKGLGGDGLFLKTDISLSEDVKNLINGAVESYGQLDYAVNCAASDEGLGKHLADIEEEDYDKQMNVNLKGIWLSMKFEIKQMVKLGKGAIVNVSSINGLGGAKGASLYSAAKSGLLGLTKAAAQEYATSGIRINAVCAGAFSTPMLDKVFKQINPIQPEAVEKQYASAIPLHRVGTPEEAAESILWLCSDASSYVTGHSMIVDGGMSSSFR